MVSLTLHNTLRYKYLVEFHAMGMLVIFFNARDTKIECTMSSACVSDAA